MLVSKAFTPKVIDDMKPWLEQITHQFLDKVADAGEMDITNDLDAPIPIQVIANMLGVDREQFKEWSIMILQQPSELEGDEVTFIRTQQEMAQYFLELFEQRRKQPEDDLISLLIQAEVDGQKLTTKDLLGFCILLISSR